MTIREPDPLRGLVGRRVLVTGASRGIGAAMAERLAAEGAAVAITARTLDHHPTLRGSLHETAERLSSYGGTVAVITANLADEADRGRIVPEARAALDGDIEVLVNNAAAAIHHPLPTMAARHRRLTFEVNVEAPLDLAQAVIPAMVERGEGWILNLSSGAAKLREGPPFAAGLLHNDVYGSSKAALNRLTNGLAAEQWGTGVRVNTVEPRAAVLSEGADEVVGSQLRADQIESMEAMVEGALALCVCPPETTGHIHVSLDVIDQLGLAVRGLDGKPLATERDRSTGTRA